MTQRHFAPGDPIAWVRVSSCHRPLANPVGDAKVLAGRQKPVTEIAIPFADVETRGGRQGLGFSDSRRAGASAGRSGLATQAGSRP